MEKIYIISAILAIMVVSYFFIVPKLIEKIYSDPKIKELKERLTIVHPAVKNIPIYSGEKSYTINKKTIYLCLKDENNNYYNDNMLTYVLLHELAHYLNTADVGHTSNFDIKFNELLEKAERLGLYNPSIPPILDYCNYS